MLSGPEASHRQVEAQVLTNPSIEVLPNREPTPRELQQVERWNGLAPSQLERTRGNARQPGVDERQDSLLQRYPELRGGQALVVDFGAGVGCATNKFREAGARVVAIEPAPAMAELTSTVPVVPYNRVIQYSATGDRELSELPNDPIKSGTVDCIICYGAFQNFPGRAKGEGKFDEAVALKVLERMHDLLKPGGKISIEYLPPQPPVTFHESTALMDPIRFRQLFEQAGFKVGTDERVFAYVHDVHQKDVMYQLIEGTKA